MLFVSRVIDRHSELSGLIADDHLQYVHTSVQRTVTAAPIFSAASTSASSLIIKRISSQTSNLLDVYNESNVLLSYIDKNGNVVGTSFTGTINLSSLSGIVGKSNLISTIAYEDESNVFTLGNQQITVDDATKKGLIIKAFVSQTASTLDIIDSSNVSMFAVGSKGAVAIRSDSTANLFAIRNSLNSTYIKFDNSDSDASPKGRLNLYSSGTQKLSLYTDGTDAFIRGDSRLIFNIGGTNYAFLDSTSGGTLSVANLDDTGTGILQINTNMTVNGSLVSGPFSCGPITINGTDLFDNSYITSIGGPTVSIINTTAGTTLSYNPVSGLLISPSFSGNGALLTNIPYSALTGTPTINTLVPTQTENNGKYLTTNGTVVSWGTVTSYSDPLTTLGDLLYRNVSSSVRLAGNTTATKKFLTQTGDATNSAAPSWGTISNTDVSGLGTLSTQNGTFSGSSSGTNTGDQTITLTGGVTGSGTGSFAAAVITNANLTGDVTSVGNATTLTNASVIAKILTGYIKGVGIVASTDSILQAIQKLDGNDDGKQSLDATLTSLASYNTNGILTQTSSDTFTGRTITGTSGKITVTDGSGVAGNPTLTTGANVPLLDAANTFTTLQSITGNSNAVQLSVKGHSTQTANIQEWLNSAGTAIGKITNSGNLSLGTTSSSGTTTPLVFNTGGTYGTNAAGSTGNLKWRMYDDGVGGMYGIGMSGSRMEFQAAGAANHTFYIGGTQVFNLSSTTATISTNIQVGNTTTAATATPITVSLGGTYGTNTAGNNGNVKLRLYDNGTGTATYGLGMSAGKLEYYAPSGAGHHFYSNAVEMLSVASTGISTFFNATASTGATTLVVKAGAGQSTTNLLDIQTSAGVTTTRITPTAIRFYDPATTTKWLEIASPNSGAYYTIATTQSDLSLVATNSNSIRFTTSGTQRAVLDPNGLWTLTPAADVLSSSSATALSLARTYTQTSTAGSVDLKITRTETTLGSGTHRLIDCYAGAAGTTNVFYVTNGGVVSTDKVQPATSGGSATLSLFCGGDSGAVWLGYPNDGRVRFSGTYMDMTCMASGAIKWSINDSTPPSATADVGLLRHSAGALRVSDGASSYGGLLASYVSTQEIRRRTTTASLVYNGDMQATAGSSHQFKYIDSGNTLSSGTAIFMEIVPTFNQTSTASAQALLINPVVTAIGSGTSSAALWIEPTGTVAASLRHIVLKGAASQTAAFIDIQNSAAGVLMDVKAGSYTNARLRLNTTNTASYTTADGTANTLEIYDVGSSDYKFQIRPRRNTAGGSLTDILLDPAYTRIYANATGANTTGRLDLYYSQLFFQGTNVYFSNTVNLNRLGDATVSNQYGSGIFMFEPSLWSGSAEQRSPTFLSVKPDTSTTLQFRFVFEGRVLPSSATTEELMQIYRNGFVGINVASVKPGAALEVKIGADTTYVAHSTITQRNRKRSSSQTGNLFETTNESGTVENAIDANGIQILKTKTPSSATDTGTTGMIAWDASYIYICTTTDTWKRVAITTW